MCQKIYLCCRLHNTNSKCQTCVITVRHYVTTTILGFGDGKFLATTHVVATAPKNDKNTNFPGPVFDQNL